MQGGIRSTDDPQHGLARKNRGIRFSDRPQEPRHPLLRSREEVKQAAQSSGITPAEFVRDTILDLIRSPDAPGDDAVPARLTPLVERTFRYTYMLATRMRDEMTAAGDQDKLDELINEARELQDSLPKKTSH